MLSLWLLATSVFLSEETGCVQGFVHDYYGIPMIGATVWVSSTEQGTRTDSTSHYFFSNVPAGLTEVCVRMQAMGFDSDSVFVTAGDTTELDFILTSGLQYLPDISREHNQETYPDTVFILIEDPQEIPLELSQVRASRELVPSWTLNENMIATALPAETGTFSLRVFPYSEFTVLNPGVGDTVSISSDQFELDSTGTIPDYPTVSHQLIDLTEWGNQGFIDWGLISSSAFYEGNGQVKLLLVYLERAVVIDETGNREVFDFPFPTFHYRTDPECRYLLVWDICGKGDVGGDAAIISLSNGETHIFDPSPEEEIPDRGWHSISSYIDPDRVPDWGKYHVLSSGVILRLNGSDLRRYSSEGRLLKKRSLHHIGLVDNNYGHQFLSLDQEAVSGVFNDDSLNYCFTVDLEGNLVQQITIPVPFRPVNRTKYISDVGSSVFWMYRPLYGLVRIDCVSRSCVHFPDMRVTSLVASLNRRYLGITVLPDGDRAYCRHDVRDWDTGELVYSVQGDSSGRTSEIQGITDSGSCLISRNTGGFTSETEYSLHNEHGDVIWVVDNGITAAPAGAYASISPTGDMLTIPCGRYIDIITIRDPE